MAELWIQHKEEIHHHYIVQGLTLKSTINIMTSRYGFSASPNQYTTKLKAWGYFKYNKSSLYPRIDGSLKRKAVDLDAVESVIVSTGSGDKLIPTKKLKKALGRPRGSKVQVENLEDAPSPPGLQVQYRRQLRNFESPQYPFTTFITELSDILGLPKVYSSNALAAHKSRKDFHDLVQNLSNGKNTNLFGCRSPARSSIQLPLSKTEACKSLSFAQPKHLKDIFQAMFLISNGQLTFSAAQKFGEWLILNIPVGIVCRLQSWSGKAVLTQLLHSAVEMDAVDILREAHLKGANLESPSSIRFKDTLLQHSLARSVQCARYLIHNGADVSVEPNIQQARWPLNNDRLQSPLEIASRSRECVDLVPALLARGASPTGMRLLQNCIRSGASCETIKSLLHAGVSPDGLGGLLTAASLGRCDIMNLLIATGACVEGDYFFDKSHMFPITASEYTQTPAIAAVASKSMEAVELLIRNKINWDASWLDKLSDRDRGSVLRRMHIPVFGRFDGIEECHPIQAAVNTGDCNFVEYLVSKGASLIPRYGPPLLVLAARKNDVAMIAWLLARGVSANSVSVSEPAVSALEVAAEVGCLPGMKLLIKAGARIDFCSSTRGSRTPLQRAASLGRLEAVKILLKYGAKINAPHCPVDGVSTLQALVSCGELRWIIRALASNAPVNSSPGELGSPLLSAIHDGKSDIVGLLIRLGAEISQSVMYEESELLPLQLAAREGHLEICQMLVKAGADIDGIASRSEGEECEVSTPLTLACGAGQESVTRYLISRNACLLGKSSTYDATPLYNALDMGDINIVRLLLENAVDPNDFCRALNSHDWQCGRSERPTPLMIACQGAVGCSYGAKEREMAYGFTELLFQYNADVNYRPSLSFNTPLQIACHIGDWKLAKLLISRGADVNAACSIRVEDSPLLRMLHPIPKGFNALQAVILKERLDLVELFLSKGADVHAPAGSTGRLTALQAAAFTGNVSIAERLLKAGAQVDEAPADVDGLTAIQSAALMGRLDMLSLLLCNYEGMRPLSEICDGAIELALKEHHDHAVDFLHAYKGQRLPLLTVEGHSNWDIEDFVNWDCI